MQDVPLTITHLFERAEQYFAHKGVVTATAGGPRADRRTASGPSAPAASAACSTTLGISADGRVATFALEHGPPPRAVLRRPVHRAGAAHAEHPAVPRAAHLHRQPRRRRGDLRRPLAARPAGPAAADVRAAAPPRADGRRQGRHPRPTSTATSCSTTRSCSPPPSPVEFHVDDEHRAASMCYTSGTTGNPKGVVYSHRSTFLHTMGAMTADSLGARESDRDPAGRADVPRQRVGPRPRRRRRRRRPRDARARPVRARRIADLIVDEKVTVAAGVPTIWMQVLPELKGRDTSSLRAIPCGGSAVPKALSEAYREQLGLPILQAWGMTETSPVASVCRLDGDQELAARRRAGRAAHRRSAGPRSASSAASSSPDTHDAGAAGRRVERRAAVPRTWIAATLLRRPAGRRELHRRRLAAHRRRGDDGRAGPDPARRPHEGPHQVGRRVDLVGRAGERADGATRRSARRR